MMREADRHTDAIRRSPVWRSVCVAFSAAAAATLWVPASAAAASLEARAFAIADAAPMEAISTDALAPTGPRQTRFKGTGRLDLAGSGSLPLIVRVGIRSRLGRVIYMFRSAGRGFPRFKGVVKTTGSPESVTGVRLVLTRGRRDKVKQQEARRVTMGTVSTTTTLSATTTTSVPGGGTTTSTTLAGGCLTDAGDGTVIDACSRLQWEKKTGPVTGTRDPTNLHDADNRYVWAGRCTIGAARCQPNAAAAATCETYDAGGGCGVCPAGAGSCDVDPRDTGAITTVWDWINRVNAERFAGYGDWRLPLQGGRNVCAGCDPRELETILDVTQPVCGLAGACIDPTFGATAAAGHWSATTRTGIPDGAWCVGFHDGLVLSVLKDVELAVRAVRDAP
jgi:hypothetical protein